MPTLTNPDSFVEVRGVGSVSKGIPTSATEEFSTQQWVREITITNPTAVTNPPGQSINVSVWDADNVYMCPDISLPPGGMYSYNGATRMNGFFWQASASGLSGKVRYTN